MLLYCENHSWLRELLILTFIHLNPSDKKAYSCSANIVASEKYPRWKRRHKVSSIIIRVEVEDQSSKLTTGHCSSLKKQAATRRCGRLEATEMASFDAMLLLWGEREKLSEAISMYDHSNICNK
ncbi:hypothetical protein M9H77_01398 [Catharanthus roseus]|uniref:Uncharacterized protein n=1 Tax=Catharanthus roseus TaxID=4058 RepID=A0ACC0C5V6_CATRO|nr:hypothetical protein M9H77_01398 [Catharanthus roseus]